jgi:hypothetical protein
MNHKAEIVKVESLTDKIKYEMWTLFEKYYVNGSKKDFIDDMDGKDSVIVMRDHKTKKVNGFMFLMIIYIPTQLGEYTVIYTGNAIVDGGARGYSALPYHKAFNQYSEYALNLKPDNKCVWLLLSNGFLTYKPRFTTTMLLKP